jgi:2-methylisocitrate lyase-like PEP mutase family enzyme
MTTNAVEKIARFRALHEAPGAWVLPNPWDAGSARMLEALGFSALATSSSAAAGTLGRVDYGLSRDEALAMAAEIVAVTTVPVSADLEDGFGASVDAVTETVRRAAAIGLAGCSIEDAPGDAEPYALELAAARVAAAVAAARAASPGAPMVITARAENFVRGREDLTDTIRRLQAYERAGADVLFAPGLPDLDAIHAVCAAVAKPVNVVAGSKGKLWSVAQLAAVGVRRISLATSLYRAAMGALREAADEVRTRGTFAFGERALASAELNAVMLPRER